MLLIQPDFCGAQGTDLERQMSYASTMTNERKQRSTSFDPIDAALRQMFNEVEKEEVPDEFCDLIAEFASKQTRSRES
ncbi:two-component response regulator [Erythrobacter sp. NAP1]|uniref:NepR family anti-sigma factor n=1 Tax=Erythrobacter sp. NAP1 TaxID=237727 RepID=UPI00006879B5|nr:NepR family anti-sigma factor [Erythrobacter sp. NAP1]EAQ28039.1 two-component response regulator [Erythrobacter sp. NAP1]